VTQVSTQRCRYLCPILIKTETFSQNLVKSTASNFLRNFTCGHIDITKLIGTFWRASAKLQKATISFVMSVRPHGTTRLILNGFSWNVISIFRKSVNKIQVSLKSDKNNGYFKSKHTLYVQYFFPKMMPFMRCGKIWYSRTGHRWHYNTAHALCMLDN
jgi:hypothetical protein